MNRTGMNWAPNGSAHGSCRRGAVLVTPGVAPAAVSTPAQLRAACESSPGRARRRSSLDELPQLFTILRGEMSLVGPRPERPHFVAEFTRVFPQYPARHRVSSGLTGWAQVNGLRGDTSIGDRATFDNYYIENWSLWLDFTIMLHAVALVARAQGGTALASPVSSRLG